MKTKNPKKEELDGEEISVGRKKLTSIFKEAFSAKTPPKEALPQQNEIFSPEQNVGKDGLEKYISEARRNHNNGFNLRKQKDFEEKYDKLHDGESSKASRTEDAKDAPVENERVKYVPRNKKKVGSRELKKVLKKYGDLDSSGESVGEEGLQDILNSMSPGISNKGYAGEDKPDKILQDDQVECRELVPVQIDGRDDDNVGVRKTSMYDALKDPIPDFELTPYAPEKKDGVKRNKLHRIKEEKSDKKIQTAMRKKVYEQKEEECIGGVISTGNIPVGREGLAHYIKNKDTAEEANSEAKATSTNEEHTPLAQEENIFNKEVFMKTVIAALLLIVMVIVGLLIKEL